MSDTRHFLSLRDLTTAEILRLLAHAQELAQAWRSHQMPASLAGRSIALWFPDTGFRNRVAFELGILAMGGRAVSLPDQLYAHESPAEIAAYLNNWFDALIVRHPSFTTMQELAAAARIPVINARTAHNHPCEILGDLSFIRSVRGSLDGLRVVFVGEATNLCHSWFEAAAQLPLHVTQVCPPGYEVQPQLLADLRIGATGTISVTHDLDDTLHSADIVYTDCWPRRRGADEHGQVGAAFAPLRITAERLDRTPSHCCFLPCPPVTRGEEVSDDAMTHPRCRVYEAKDFLLHAQNALLVALLSPSRTSQV